MHPEIRQIGPGTCPICGMALEPEMVELGIGPNPELIDIKRRFWIGLALTLPVFLLEMGGHISAGSCCFAPRWSNWIQLVLATPVVLWGGWPFFVRAGRRSVAQPQHVHVDRDGHWRRVGLQHRGDVFARHFPARAFADRPARSPVYFEAAAVITVLVLLGQVLELRAREQTGDAIRALLGWRQSARCVRGWAATRRWRSK